MRRCLELMVLLGTAGILVATQNPNPPPSRAPCGRESLNLRADTTCGSPTDLTVSTTESCGVSVTAGDLAWIPADSPAHYETDLDAGLSAGFELEGVIADGGRRSCVATAADGGGFTIECVWGEVCDGGQGFIGSLECGVTCSGTLLLRN